MTTGAIGQQLKLRLFLEGIEVPVIGAQVQMNLNAPATASIQVIPLDPLLELKARTMVHLFYWDFNEDIPDQPEEGEEGIDGPVATTSDPNSRLDKYKLLFSGEVVGLAFMKSPSGRQAVLQCADFSTYWDTTYQIFISWSPNGNWSGDKSSVWSGGNTLFHNLLSSHGSVLSSTLRKRPQTDGLKDVRGLMGGIIALLEKMGGVPEHISGVNDFFTIAELKNHLLQQIVAEENDNTAQRLFKAKTFSAWMNRRISSLGELVSFRDMLKLLFQYIYYETVPIPAAKFVPSVAKKEVHSQVKVNIRSGGVLNEEQRRVVRTLLRTTKKYDGSSGDITTLEAQRSVNEEVVAKRIEKKLASLLRTRTKVSVTQQGEGAARIIVRGVAGVGAASTVPRTGEVSSQQVTVSGGGGDTTSSTSTGVGVATRTVKNTRTGEVTTITSEPSLFTGDLVPKARKILESAKTKTTFIRKVTAESFRLADIVTGVQVFTTAVTGPANARRAVALEPPKRSIAPFLANRGNWKRISDDLLKALNLGTKTRSKLRRKVDKTAAKLDKLHTQIFRPDCFFVAPPKCNVLFPEQYTQFQYQRNFLQEITRLRLTTGLQFISGKGSSFFQSSHFAPATKDIKELAKSQGNKGLRTLLPWEKYSGILPKFEHISEVNYHANRRQRKIQKNVIGHGRNYAQRAANFNFMKYRFAPRTLTVSAKFAPQFVLGFPALIIDKPFMVDPADIVKALQKTGIRGTSKISMGSLILSNIGSLSVALKAPTQYLGMPAGVSHMVDQKGGVTNVTLTHARTHRITDDDFLGVFSAEMSDRVSTRTETTVLDAEELLKSGDYKRLRYLIDCTPQNILDQIESDILAADNPVPEDDQDFSEELLGLDKRPTGAPDLSLSKLAPFFLGSSLDLGLFQGNPIKVRSSITEDLSDQDFNEATGKFELGGSRVIRLRGTTKRSTLKGTRLTILEPNPYSEKTRPGSRGLFRKGKVSQIQLFSDAVIEISSADVNKFIKSRRDKKALRKRKQKGENSDSFFLWRKIAVHEEVAVNARQKKTIPIEESIRPPWFSPLYSNLFIGDNIYDKFFGVGSIVDQSLFTTPEGEAFFSSSAEREEILSKIKQADGDPVTVAEILNRPENQSKTLSEIPSVETSTDALAFIYGDVRRQGADVQKFVADYTSRPIATMRDILGTIDLEYKASKDKSTLEIVSGKGGFHSTAVAPFEDLLGLMDNPDLELARLHKKGKKFPISKALDPRKGRREMVEAYSNAIGGSRGSLGVGLLG